MRGNNYANKEMGNLFAQRQVTLRNVTALCCILKSHLAYFGWNMTQLLVTTVMLALTSQV